MKRAKMPVDVLKEIRRALRALRRAEAYMAREERRQRKWIKQGTTSATREELAEQG